MNDYGQSGTHPVEGIWEILNETEDVEKPSKAYFETDLGGYKYYDQDHSSSGDHYMVWCNQDGSESKEFNAKSFNDAMKKAGRHYDQLKTKHFKKNKSR